MSGVRIAAKRFPESVLALFSKFKADNGVYQIPSMIVEALIARPADEAPALLQLQSVEADDYPHLTKRIHRFLSMQVPRGEPLVIIPSEQSSMEYGAESLLSFDYSYENSQNENCLADFGCPECGSQDGVSIEVLATASFSDNGSEIEGGDHEYDDNSSCTCNACKHSGTVKSFYTLHDE